MARMMLCSGALIIALIMGCTAEQQPEISWNSPGDKAEVYGLVRLSAAAQARDGVAQVQFFLDATNPDQAIGTVSASTDSAYIQPWYTSAVPNGTHTLIAVAEDTSGNRAEAGISVTVANVSRADSIPADAIKMDPGLDQQPPRLEAAFSGIWEDPVPLGGPINTAGGEDSPFITPDGRELFSWFTPDVNIPAQEQVSDRVTGIYRSEKVAGMWTEPERIYLTYFDEPCLDGCATVRGTMLWFCSARAGNYRDIDMWTARSQDSRWTAWSNAGELLNQAYEIGELHVSADGTEIYFDSRRAGGKGEKDIWVTRQVNGAWSGPENIAAVNTAGNEGWPFLSEDGSELWFTRIIGAPEIYRSLNVGGTWQEPERVLSSFAGEPTLDQEGNIYFVHHYWDGVENRMIEADYYVCYRRR